jgi:ribosomal protein S18 acetylase RimI-like enzyme
LAFGSGMEGRSAMDAGLFATLGPVSRRLADGAAVVVRPLRPDDGGALGDFYAAVPRADLRFYCPYPLTREQAARNAARALDPHRVVLVLEAADGGIAGYAWFQWEAGRDRSHFGICIRRDHQDRGAGRLLIERLLDIARATGPPLMTLTVQAANGRAVRLYRSMGFRIVREQTRRANPDMGFGEEPEYCMERRVR